MTNNKKKRRETSQVGEAGVHYVVSELCRRGWIALATARNARAVDIIVMRPDSFDFRGVQVKSSHKHTKFWPVAFNGRPSSNFLFVFVRPQGEAEGSPFEAFVVSSERVHRKKTKRRGNWPGSWYLPKNEESVKTLRNNWNSIWQ